MLHSESRTQFCHSSNLMFMRRRQAAELLLSLVDNQTPSLPVKNQLMDALYQLPTDCFIANDWHVILQQITYTLLQQENKHGARMPTHLTQLLSQLQLRFKSQAGK